MNLPVHITFTGIDDNTSIDGLVALHKRYQGLVEWGILIGDKEGTGRWPSRGTRQKLTDANFYHGLQLAVHLCGMHALCANFIGRTKASNKGIRRFQVNLPEGKYDLYQMRQLSERIAFRPVIMQHREGPFPRTPDRLLQYLHDPSAGTGKLPEERRPHEPDDFRLVGYAGGLGPDNILRELRKMEARTFWVDMESGVRADGRLDLAKCEAVLAAVYGARP